jgi:hypothetical protein
VHLKFLASYLSLADEYGVPAFLPRVTRERLEALAMGDMAEEFVAILEKVDAARVPVLDEIIIDTLVDLNDKETFYREKIQGIKLIGYRELRQQLTV